ncbi:FtsK/SpoIIIE domain-containing protein [Clostridium perfringens]|uniref:FtsK/SpoIIIE domain-containing protein n=1 Tax=Clostridium perfringens TaxID=1502 RepID=UPI000F521751|nr:FtsK/SpoIIIE domain-containing protein [Clostridium perfringens]
MILEAMLSAAFGGALYGYIQSRDKNNEKIKIGKDKIEQRENMKIWKKCLEFSDVKGIINKNNDTFTLEDYKKTSYGFSAITKAPLGCDWMSLRSVENALETAFQGTVEIQKEKYTGDIKVEVITRKPEFEFKPVKLTSNEWLGGFKANGTPFNIDLNLNPHILYAGKTGSGKTFAMFISFTNMLYNYKNDFDVYITQLVNAETKIFSKCKPCKMTASTLEEALVVLEKIVEICDKREKEISKYGYVSVRHFNEDYPNKKFKRIILLMDEFSFFKIEDGDTDEDKKLKNKCEICLKRIAKAGRSMNITIIGALQKATVENINSSVRSQMCMISLRQFSGQDSKITIGTTEASRLDDCEAIIKGSNIYEKVFIPIIKSKQPQIELQKYDKNIIVPRKGVIIEDVVKEKEEKLK